MGAAESVDGAEIARFLGVDAAAYAGVRVTGVARPEDAVAGSLVFAVDRKALAQALKLLPRRSF